MISDVISREISREIDVRASIKTPNPNTHTSLCSIQDIYFAKMKCLHGEPCAQSTTEKGTFWFCNQNPSCKLICSGDESYLYEKAIGAWKSTKQTQPRCEKQNKLAKIRIVKNLLEANYGRPFFVCSEQTNPCYTFLLGLGRRTSRSKTKMPSRISMRHP